MTAGVLHPDPLVATKFLRQRLPGRRRMIAKTNPLLATPRKRFLRWVLIHYGVGASRTRCHVMVFLASTARELQSPVAQVETSAVRFFST